MSDTAVTTSSTPQPQAIKHIAADSELRKLKYAEYPSIVAKAAEKDLLNPEPLDDNTYPASSNIFKALTLLEFDNGILLSNSTPEAMKTFAVDFMHRLREQYGCTSPSDLASCELAALGYVRIIETQRQLKNAENEFAADKTRLILDYIQVLSKELDRAQRHYQAAIQALDYAKRPPVKMTVNVKGSANIAQNQQVNNTDEVIRPDDFGGQKEGERNNSNR